MQSKNFLRIMPAQLYETKDEISYPLLLILKKSLQLGILPSDWKLASSKKVNYIVSFNN